MKGYQISVLIPFRFRIESSVRRDKAKKSVKYLNDGSANVKLGILRTLRWLQALRL
jgi:hypothetical protein